jgi:hypothetical protein
VEKIEKKVAHYKAERTKLFDLKAHALEIKEKLKTIQKIMYANLKEFKDHSTHFITYLENVKDK